MRLRSSQPAAGTCRVSSSEDQRKKGVSSRASAVGCGSKGHCEANGSRKTEVRRGSSPLESLRGRKYKMAKKFTEKRVKQAEVKAKLERPK